MEKDKWIESYWGNEESGARRKYYRITPEGRDTYIQKVNEWKEIITIMNNLIGSGL
jgi:PadR family transcriptional regulator PadR